METTTQKICGKCKHYKEHNFPINICDNPESDKYKDESVHYHSTCETGFEMESKFNFKLTDEGVKPI